MPTRLQRISFWRLIRANLFDLASLLRQSAVALTGFVVVALGSATYLHLRIDRPIADPVAALYQSLKLPILQGDEPFPPPTTGLAKYSSSWCHSCTLLSLLPDPRFLMEPHAPYGSPRTLLCSTMRSERASARRINGTAGNTGPPRSYADRESFPNQ